MNNVQETGSQLTAMQQQRYDLLYPIYGEESEIIVKSLSGKSRGSWQSFLDKMEHVRKAKTSEKEYYAALYESFELNREYTPSEVIGIIGEVRREMGLDLYIDKIKIQSEHDFFLVFVVREVHEEQGEEGKKKKVKGYIPLIKVLPE